MASRPPPPSWLDKNFVQRALHEGEDNPLLIVTSCEVSVGNALGDGNTSDIYRIISKIQDSQERRVIVKCHPQGGHRGEFVKKTNIFDNETKIQTEILPAMHKLLEDAKPGKYPPFTAKCLYHGDEPLPFLVLEDLKHFGFNMAKRQQGVDVQHCSLTVKTLARFHATSLALHDKDPSMIEQFNKPIFREESKQFLSPLLDDAIQSLEEQISKWPEFEKYGHKLNNIKYKLFDRKIELCKKKDNEFNVLIHGDAWISNLMYRYSEEGPQEMRLIDFQNCIYASPALDLQCFFYTSPSDEVRVKYMDDLIEQYHTTFVNTLEDLGSSSHMMSLSQLHKMMDDYALYGFLMAIWVLPVVLSNPEDGFDIEKSMDVGCDVTETNRKIYSNRTYTDALKRMLPLFEEKGVFDIL